MGTVRISSILGLAAVFLVGVAGVALSAPVPDEEEALRKKALALNDVTGDDPIKGEIKALLDDLPGTKKLVAVAARMAKEKKQPFTYNGAFILARVALQVRDLDSSRTLYEVCAEQASKLQSVQKLIQAYRGLSAVIELLYLDRKYDKTVKASQEFLEILEKQGVSSALKADVLRRMVQAMAKQGKIDEATKMVDNLIKTREADWRNLELKAWLLRETKQYAEAVKLYESLLTRVAGDKSLQDDERAEVDAQIRLSIIDTLYDDKKYDKSAKTARELLAALKGLGASAQTRGEVILRVVRALARQGKYDEAARLAEDLPESKDETLADLELKARLLRESGKDAEAARLYELMLARVPKDEAVDEGQRPAYAADLHYMLSGVYVDLNQIDKATAHLKALLAQEPNNPTYNNDLGYIWADHDMNLDEAEKMIRKALVEDRKERKKKDVHPAEDKDNAAYLDSLGWVLFKKKNYAEAKKYLLEAVKDKEGQHIEIMDHLGDCYLALGDKAEAVATWKKALTLDTNSKRERQRRVEVEHKLKTNK